MKILYDHQIFTEQIYGGISRYFIELANHIALNNPEKVTDLISKFVKKPKANEQPTTDMESV